MFQELRKVTKSFKRVEKKFEGTSSKAVIKREKLAKKAEQLADRMHVLASEISYALANRLTQEQVMSLAAVSPSPIRKVFIPKKGWGYVRS